MCMSMDKPILPIPASNHEVYRPFYHFTPVAHWMNDPNGLVYYQGEYHLFYQYYPEGMAWGPMHWGHAVSTDLVHWQQLPIALFPDAAGDIWSGSVVVDVHNSSGFFPDGSGLVALYTLAGAAPQQQCLAYSVDRGRTWTKYAGNPVLANPGVTDFRDPKVIWHAPTQRWIMIVAGGIVRFYSSPDLKIWTFESLLSDESECPDFFALPVDGNTQQQQWVVSLGGRTYYLGDFDGHSFHKTAGPFVVDYGADFYAVQSYSDIPEEDGRRIWIGWMDNWEYGQQVPTSPWRGAMTVPRCMTLQTRPDGVRLLQAPVRELRSLHGPCTHLEQQTVRPDNNIVLAADGDVLDISVKFQLETASEFGLLVRVGQGQRTLIGYDTVAKQLFVDRTQAGVSDFNSTFAARHCAPLAPDNMTITLRILVDRSSVEVFANGGVVVLTEQIFPDPASTGVQVYALDGTVTLCSLDLYPMQ